MTGEPSVRRPVPAVRNIFVPLFIVLTLLAVVNTLQSFYLFSAEIQYYDKFLATFVSKAFYFWYFLLPAYVVWRLAVALPFGATRFVRWIGIHAAVLAGSFVLHQSFAIGVNKGLWGERFEGSFLFLLFNNPSFWIEALGYGILAAGMLLIDFQRMQRENEIRYAEMEADLINARLQEVRNRIHPQFLFSTLDFIGRLVREERNKEGNKVLSALSDFLRITVYDNEQEEIPLEEEVRYLDIYTGIEMLRLSPSLTVEKNISANAERAAVPNFILQPVVEEMIYCGEGPSISRCGIFIAAETTDGTLIVTVSRSPGGNITPDDLCKRDVVMIMNKKIRQLYGAPFGVAPAAGEGGSCAVRISLPHRTGTAEREGGDR